MDFISGHDYMTWPEDFTGMQAWPEEATGSDLDSTRSHRPSSISVGALDSDIFGGRNVQRPTMDYQHHSAGSLGHFSPRCSSPTMGDRDQHSTPSAQRPTLNAMMDFVLELQASRTRHSSQSVDDTGWLRDDDLAFVASNSLCAMAEDTIDEIQARGSTVSQHYTELYLIGKACTPIVEMIHTLSLIHI